jgi:hypothetical protein
LHVLITGGAFFITLRMQRRKGQFAGRASLEGESPAPGFDPGSQGSGLDFASRESKSVLYFISQYLICFFSCSLLNGQLTPFSPPCHTLQVPELRY